MRKQYYISLRSGRSITFETIINKLHYSTWANVFYYFPPLSKSISRKWGKACSSLLVSTRFACFLSSHQAEICILLKRAAEQKSHTVFWTIIMNAAALQRFPELILWVSKVWLPRRFLSFSVCILTHDASVRLLVSFELFVRLKPTANCGTNTK